ncbi:hypothetical protein OPV22_019827 [Ensete ventricosum]|uniref:Uncharacterized protein n=1 Tax=Ensete ventricosum TaxID=4639 RepID=A0AAV8QEW5_ENSVE|nr:hypothetical protein OPV22_019827 [Ensete ventricosum]
MAATVRSEDWSFSVQFLGLDLDFALFSPRVRREAKSWCLRESYRVLPSVVDSLYIKGRRRRDFCHRWRALD